MASRQQCEFFLVRYVPDPVRNEFVHVGVILRAARAMGAGIREPGQMLLKFTSDWRRVRCLDPDADTGMLEGLECELRRRFREEPAGNLFHVLEDSFSNSVQVSRGKAYLAESMEAGVEELMRLYVEPLKREKLSRLSGRASIQAQMRGEFERAGVWELMRKRIEAAQYTRPGDPLRIDCGYRVMVGENGPGPAKSGPDSSLGPLNTIRMFQAVSLEPSAGMGVEAAKVLAFSAPSLMAGVQRVERSWLELTAVVEPLGKLGTNRQGIGISRGDAETAGVDAERAEAYRYAVETMEEHRIRVVTTADLARVAETARREMGV